MNDDNVNYYLTYQGQEEQEVNKAAFIVAERQAGFRPKLASTDPEYMNTCATGGFWGNGVKGRIQYGSPTGRLTQSQPQLQAVPGSPTVALEMAAAGITQPTLRTLLNDCQALITERDQLKAVLTKALELLDNIRGDINPERGYADELEKEIADLLAEHYPKI